MAISELLSSTEFVSAIVGAVVGTVGGGLVSYFLQNSAATKAKENAKKDRTDRETALARSLILKLMLLHTDVQRVHDHLLNGAVLQVRNPNAPLWGAVKPIANFPTTTAITSEEIALLLPLKDDRVANAVLNCDRMRDAVVDLIREYSRLRNALAEKLTPAVPGPDGQAPILIKDIKAFPREMFELDQIIRDMIPLVDEYGDAITGALHGAHRVLSEKYSLAFTLNAPGRPPIHEPKPN